jgi:hypothetical protein
VHKRIESHPALTPRRIVPEQMRDEAVRRLVKGDRNNERNDPGRDLVERQRKPCGHDSTLRRQRYCGATPPSRCARRRHRLQSLAKRTMCRAASDAIEFKHALDLTHRPRPSQAAHIVEPRRGTLAQFSPCRHRPCTQRFQKERDEASVVVPSRWHYDHYPGIENAAQSGDRQRGLSPQAALSSSLRSFDTYRLPKPQGKPRSPLRRGSRWSAWRLPLLAVTAAAMSDVPSRTGWSGSSTAASKTNMAG